MEKQYLGIDIGGTQVKWTLLDANGAVLKQDLMPTGDNIDGAGRWKNSILSLVQEQQGMAQKYGKDLQCAISAPGLVNKENTMIANMPERLSGIVDFNWSAACGQPISVLNDGHAACLAEYETHYRDKGIQHFLMLTLGTGVGGGIIINGQLYQGNGQRAGHVGHTPVDINGPATMTNMPGSLEYGIGNFSVEQRTQGKFKSTKTLVAAYEMGNAQAKVFWLASVRHLAAGIAGLANTLSPEIIVLGGGITAGAKDSLLTPLSRAMDSFEWRPNGEKTIIKQAKLGAYAGALGAAFFAKKNN